MRKDFFIGNERLPIYCSNAPGSLAGSDPGSWSAGVGIFVDWHRKPGSPGLPVGKHGRAQALYPGVDGLHAHRLRHHRHLEPRF